MSKCLLAAYVEGKAVFIIRKFFKKYDAGHINLTKLSLLQYSLPALQLALIN